MSTFSEVFLIGERSYFRLEVHSSADLNLEGGADLQGVYQGLEKKMGVRNRKAKPQWAEFSW